MTRLFSRPYPLGATLNKEGCNFSIHAPGVKDIQLALFASDGSYSLHDLPNEYAGIRHTFIPDIKPGKNMVTLSHIEMNHYSSPILTPNL